MPDLSQVKGQIAVLQIAALELMVVTLGLLVYVLQLSNRVRKLEKPSTVAKPD